MFFLGENKYSPLSDAENGSTVANARKGLGFQLEAEMSFKETEPLTRLVFAESVANEARHNSSSARSLARFALILSLLAIAVSLFALFR
jgi:hypothetical protein